LGVDSLGLVCVSVFRILNDISSFVKPTVVNMVKIEPFAVEQWMDE
jgi:hypothetical protein